MLLSMEILGYLFNYKCVYRVYYRLGLNSNVELKKALYVRKKDR